MKYSIVIPVYKNAESIPRLLTALQSLATNLQNKLEVVFVVDGSPDNSYSLLSNSLTEVNFCSQLIALSRNFGSFAAIRTGLELAKGDFIAVLAADLQEPPELILSFFEELSSGEYDIAVGVRKNRNDPLLSRICSNLFWSTFKKFVIREIPNGGVDVFACNRAFKDQLLKMEESRSSLIALLYWLGFRRVEIPYTRQKRQEGKSAWSLRKKIDYMFDSFFAFTDYPIKLLLRTGIIGFIIMFLYGIFLFISKLLGKISVDGYTTLLIIMLLIEMVNLIAFAFVGIYSWRAYENTKNRPHSVIMEHKTFASGED